MGMPTSVTSYACARRDEETSPLPVSASSIARSGCTPSHSSAPNTARAAATYSALSQPNRWARNGVRVGDNAPPRFPPMFIKPDTVPAYELARSMVEAQYAAAVRNNEADPRARSRIARYGSEAAAPAQMNPAVSSRPLTPTPHRPMRFPNRRLA